MSRSVQKKEKYAKSGEPSLDNSDQGSAARTRPLSFDEIMIRRKNKKLSENFDEGAKEVENISRDSTIEKVSAHRKSERQHRHKKDSSPSVGKHLLEEVSKVYSRKKKDNTLRKDGDSARQKDRQSYDSEIKFKDENLAKAERRESSESEIRLKDGSLAKHTGRESHGSETKLKTDMKKELFSKVKGKIEKQDPGWGKNYDRSSYDVEDQASKKHSRDSTGKERHVDRSGGQSERESKRKYRNEDGEQNRDKSDAKKHDLGKGRKLQISEKKERKESSKSRYGESKLKRRRSRSQEHEERNRRSISLSPGAYIRTSHYGQKHEDLSSQSFKGKSGRQHSDIDRSRVTNNGSGGHYRWHGESMSELGGYSPRKRKTEAAAKTPSPINRSPEKKSAKWDVAPVETDGSFASSVPSNIQTSNQTASSNLHEAVSSTLVTSTVVNPLSGPYSASLTKQIVSVDSVQLTQATRPMRRLYVENVPASASEKAVMEFLNNILLSLRANYVQGSLPCISCNIQTEKGQALVEFLTPEAASAALSCDGCSFSGCILRIRRPKDFIDVASGEAKKSLAAVGAISDIVKDSPHKIFIGGISRTVSSKMVMEIASVFGPLKSYHFENIEDRDEPCAFLEYVDQSVTFKACAGLNGMKLGGQIITVVQAVPDGSSMENSCHSPFYGIPEHAIPLLEKPTRVLKIKNVFNPEGISSLSELEVEEVLEDVRLECARFDSVKSINVVKYEARHANDNKKAETLEDDINGSEFPGQLDRVDGNMVEDLTREGLSETVSQEVLKQSKTLKDDSRCHDKRIPRNIQTKDVSSENKSSAEEELNFEEVNTNTQEVVGRLDGSDDNLAHVFEVGSVFVEYRRTEASCMATHCLHGRPFDDRTVTVEYVPLELYKAKFPK